MIENEKQYQVTLNWIAGFEKSIASLGESDVMQNKPELLQYLTDAYKSQVEELKEEVAAYLLQKEVSQ